MIGMPENQPCDERGETEFPVHDGENDQPEQCGRHFQPPGNAIVRVDGRPREHSNENQQPGKQLPAPVFR
jgi:hypothetical protein